MTTTVDDSYNVVKGGSLQDGPTVPNLFSVIVTPTTFTTFAINCPISEGPFTATVTGGVAPFTYAWTEEAAASITIDSPTAQSTTISKTAAGGEQVQLRCTVTDSDNVTAVDEVGGSMECGT